MTTATATRPRQRRAADEPLPEVLCTSILNDGAPCWVVQSSSDPSRVWIVREVGVDGKLQCQCPAGEHGRKCKHVSSVAHEILMAELRQCEARRIATAEALDRVRASLDAADERQRREHSACRPMNDPAPAAFSLFK